MPNLSNNLFGDGPANSILDSPSAPIVPPVEEEEPEMREFGDVNATRRAIYDRVFEAASEMQPSVGKMHTLRLINPVWGDPENFSKRQRKEAVLAGRSMGRRLRGTWQLTDNETGEVVDQRDQVVARAPYVTHSGTFVHNGNEYAIKNQQRLRAGIFVREKDNGELEAHANVLANGPSHRYFIDPAQGVFYIRMGQAKIPLMPLVRAMGATDKDLREAWGPEIHAANYQKNDSGALKKLQEKLLRGREGGVKELVEAYQKMELDPEVTGRTLGVPYENLSLEAIMATTKKLLAVGRKEAEVDDRDHLAYQTFLGPEDLIAERLRKDRGGLRRQLMWKASLRGNLQSMPSSALQDQIDAAMLESGLGQSLEEINPAEIFDKQTQISRMGEGGIGSLQAVPDEARGVQPSHLGFMDPLRTPECYDEITEVMTRQGWKPWPVVREEDQLACLVDGKLEYHYADKLVSYRYEGQMFGAKTSLVDYLVTPDHRMHVRRGYDTPHWRIETAEQTHEAHVRILRCGGHASYESYSTDRGLPPFESRSNNSKPVDLDDTDLCDWAEFVGWYLSEGNLAVSESRQSYKIMLTQDPDANPENCRRLYALLDRLPFEWSFCNRKKGMAISRRHLYEWALPFGKCDGKFIPEVCFDWPEEARRALLEGLLLGDGRRAVKGGRAGELTQYCSSSRRLAYDVHRLLFDLGVSSRVVFEKDEREERYLGCWIVHIHVRTQRCVSRGHATKDSDYYVENYNGRVYCASVPGGLLYVRRNESCGIWCGNSFRVGVDVHIARNARKGKNGKMYSLFRDLKTGKDVWRTPQQMADQVVTFPGALRQTSRPPAGMLASAAAALQRTKEGRPTAQDAQTLQALKDFKEVPLVRVPAMRRGRIQWVLRDEVDLELPAFENAFSPLGNMVPLKSMVKGQRVAMASRMLTQALPLTEPEAPLVQSGVPGSGGTTSFEDEYGKHMGAERADKGGRVLATDDDRIIVQYDDGSREEVELYNNHPHNRKTYIHQTATVKPGQRFAAGDLLARSNYTDQEGSTALGLNARVAYVPWGGKNFEDAIVISEGMAKRLTSEHMYQHDLSTNENTRTGKNNYISLFPGKYDRDTLLNLDDDGLVKVGTEVNYGDPLILAAEQRGRALNKVHKKRQAGFLDKTVTWKHHDVGVVTDVVQSKRGPVVLVKSRQEMRVGDKMCYDPATSLLTRSGWKPVAEITADDELATLNAETGELEYHYPTHIHNFDHAGDMYYLNTKHLNMLVTMEHRLWVARPGEKYRAVTAGEFYNSKGEWRFKKDCTWRGTERTWMTFSEYIAHNSRDNTLPAELPMDDWLEFLGYYLAEGRVTRTTSGGYQTQISQFKSSLAWEKIEDTLLRIGLRYTYRDAEKRFEINSKQLYGILEPLGDTYSKYVPGYAQELCPRQLLILFDAYMDGDGHRGACHEFSSSSYRLAEDMQVICLKLGWCVTLKSVDRTDNFQKKPHWRGRVNRRHLRPWWKKSRVAQYESVEEKVVQYDGKVHCITVPNHIVYCKREDKTYWSLNSGRYG